jgi:hypothetical protein
LCGLARRMDGKMWLCVVQMKLIDSLVVLWQLLDFIHIRVIIATLLFIISSYWNIS